MNEQENISVIFESLYEVIKNRKATNPKDSYTASLFKKGKGKICNKLGEETVETIVAALSEEKSNVIHESADMLFHLFVLWVQMGIELQEISDELKGRFGTSGFEEKKRRLVEN